MKGENSMINPNYPHKNAKVKPKLENSWCVSQPYPPKTYSVCPCFLCLEALVEKNSPMMLQRLKQQFCIFKNISRLGFDTIKRVFFCSTKDREGCGSINHGKSSRNFF